MPPSEREAQRQALDSALRRFDEALARFVEYRRAVRIPNRPPKVPSESATAGPPAVMGLQRTAPAPLERPIAPELSVDRARRFAIAASIVVLVMATCLWIVRQYRGR